MNQKFFGAFCTFTCIMICLCGCKETVGSKIVKYTGPDEISSEAQTVIFSSDEDVTASISGVDYWILDNTTSDLMTIEHGYLEGDIVQTDFCTITTAGADFILDFAENTTGYLRKVEVWYSGTDNSSGLTYDLSWFDVIQNPHEQPAEL